VDTFSNGNYIAYKMCARSCTEKWLLPVFHSKLDISNVLLMWPFIQLYFKMNTKKTDNIALYADRDKDRFLTANSCLFGWLHNNGNKKLLEKMKNKELKQVWKFEALRLVYLMNNIKSTFKKEGISF